MEINLRKKEQKARFKNPFQIGDNVRVEIPGLQKNLKVNILMKYILLLMLEENVLY